MTDLPTTFHSQRLAFRPARYDSMSARYLLWLNDPELNRYMETRYTPQTEETARAFIEGVTRDPRSWMFSAFATVGVEQQHVGNIKIGPWHPRHNLADIALFVGKEYWRRGYGLEMIQAATLYAGITLGIRKLCAHIHKDNIWSQQAFHNAGYHQEATLTKHYHINNNRYGDICVFTYYSWSQG